jgi:hypothetical protein
VSASMFYTQNIQILVHKDYRVGLLVKMYEIGVWVTPKVPLLLQFQTWRKFLWTGDAPRCSDLSAYRLQGRVTGINVRK